MRRARVGEHVCRCPAYRFPHRLTGGACTGASIVLDHWDANHGGGLTCRDCHFLADDSGFKSCQVVNGAEDPRYCPVWQSFMQAHEIKLGNRYVER